MTLPDHMQYAVSILRQQIYDIEDDLKEHNGTKYDYSELQKNTQMERMQQLHHAINDIYNTFGF
jgi:hypothetical protein